MNDYIIRNAAVEKAMEYCPDDDGSCSKAGTDLRELLDELEDIPAADVKPVVRGKWDGTADGYADGNLVYDIWECSCCGYDADGAEEKPTWNFCPNCGADMREEHNGTTDSK